jgi:hypothetical protein
MKTTRSSLNPIEVAAILPGLEAILNGIADAREGRYHRGGLAHLLPWAKTTYAEQRFDADTQAGIPTSIPTCFNA